MLEHPKNKVVSKETSFRLIAASPTNIGGSTKGRVVPSHSVRSSARKKTSAIAGIAARSSLQKATSGKLGDFNFKTEAIPLW